MLKTHIVVLEAHNACQNARNNKNLLQYYSKLSNKRFIFLLCVI